MADIEAVRSVRTYRVDAVGAAAIVLTADAVVLLVASVVGVPFLLFLFGDEDGTWQHLWPLTVSWLIAVVLAAVSIIAVAGLSGFGDYSIRRFGTAAALGTAAAAAVLAAASSPGWLLLTLPLTVANLAAALVLAGRDRVAAGPDRFPLFRPAVPIPVDDAPTPAANPPYAHDEVVYARPADAPALTRDTIDLLAVDGAPGTARTLRRPASPRRRPAQVQARARLRARSALRTHAGGRLPRRQQRSAE